MDKFLKFPPLKSLLILKQGKTVLVLNQVPCINLLIKHHDMKTYGWMEE
jgi:hypothetical protein